MQIGRHTQKKIAKVDARHEASEVQVLLGDEFNPHDRCRAVTFRHLKRDRVILNAFSQPFDSTGRD